MLKFSEKTTMHACFWKENLDENMSSLLVNKKRTDDPWFEQYV